MSPCVGRCSSRRQLVARWLATAALGFSVLPAVAGADHDAPFDRTVSDEQCPHLALFIEVAADDVAGFVPAPFELSHPPGDPERATVFIVGLRCDRLTVDGRERGSMTYGYLSVGIEPPPHPAESNSTFGPIDALGSNFYLLFWVTDNDQFANWLRAGTGLGNRVRVVDDLDYRYRPVLGLDPEFRFVAPFPTPSPYEIEAAVQEPSSPPVAVIADLWADTDQGVVRIETVAPNERLGLACGEVRTDPGSDMARIFGGTEARSFCDPVASLLADTGQWTKEVFP